MITRYNILESTVQQIRFKIRVWSSESSLSSSGVFCTLFRSECAPASNTPGDGFCETHRDRRCAVPSLCGTRVMRESRLCDCPVRVDELRGMKPEVLYLTVLFIKVYTFSYRYILIDITIEFVEYTCTCTYVQRNKYVRVLSVKSFLTKWVVVNFEVRVWWNKTFHIVYYDIILKDINSFDYQMIQSLDRWTNGSIVPTTESYYCTSLVRIGRVSSHAIRTVREH